MTAADDTTDDTTGSRARAPAGARRSATRPLTARSVVLSLLLGAHPPELPVRDIVRAGELFAISEATLRVALSRMVGAGDLDRRDGTYRLTRRLVERQTRQDDATRPSTRPWRGDWEITVVTSVGRGAADRAELRARLTELRLAELREGTWLRPANLRRNWPAELGGLLRRFTARPDDDSAELAGQLWDLPGWAATAETLLERLDTTADPAERFTTAAAAVRHLLRDPVLPPELLPAQWPGEDLRDRYAAYQGELAALLLVTQLHNRQDLGA
jgi:phenylacetic acid degradation operon negative regulatory protein